MEINDFWLWEFDKELKEDCLIKCPECNKFNNHKLWTEGEAECDDCGSHAAIICPECDEYFDHINGPTFEIKYQEIKGE
jgi:hypothetical protein